MCAVTKNNIDQNDASRFVLQYFFELVHSDFWIDHGVRFSLSVYIVAQIHHLEALCI
ncbi:hypothetical protein D3C75_1305430 [compost metagenome]